MPLVREVIANPVVQENHSAHVHGVHVGKPVHDDDSEGPFEVMMELYVKVDDERVTFIANLNDEVLQAIALSVAARDRLRKAESGEAPVQ